MEFFKTDKTGGEEGATRESTKRKRSIEDWKSMSQYFFVKWFKAENENLQQWKKIKYLEAKCETQKQIYKDAAVKYKESLLHFKEEALHLSGGI